jgi:hypothetical protein
MDTKIAHGLLRQIGATRRGQASEDGIGRWDVPL